LSLTETDRKNDNITSALLAKVTTANKTRMIYDLLSM